MGERNERARHVREDQKDLREETEPVQEVDGEPFTQEQIEDLLVKSFEWQGQVPDFTSFL